MKKIISILVLAAMMLSTVLAVIPMSAAETGGTQEAYSIDWKSLYEDGLMRAQWCYDTTDKQNNYDDHYTVTATETGLSSVNKGDGDVRSYYSTLQFDITEDTYYQYEFEAKNNVTPATFNGGIVFAYATNPNAFTKGAEDWDADAAGTKTAPYCLSGVFQNSADITVSSGAAKGIKLSAFFGRDNDDRYKLPVSKSDSAIVAKGVAAQNADGYVKYKIIYNGLNVTIWYNAALNTEIYTQLFDIDLPTGSKVAFGVFSRLEQTVAIRNCKVTARNTAATTAMAKAWLALTVADAKVEAAKQGFTEGTIAALNSAIISAENALANTEKSAHDYKEEKTALENAIAGLKKSADKTILKQHIESAGEMELAEYTDDTREALELALAAAEAADSDTEIEQADVDTAAANLWNAMIALAKKGSVNRILLNAAISSCAALVEADYTAYSWSAYKTAYDTADALNKGVAEDPVIDSFKVEDYADEAARNKAFYDAVAVRQTAVNDAIVALEDATKALVNAKELNAIIKKAEALVEKEYTPTSWTAADIATKLDSAKDAATNVETVKTQGEVDALAEELGDAIASLEKLADFTELKALIAKAEGLNKRDYVGDAASINEALTAAKNAVEDTINVYLQKDVDEIYKALYNAVDALAPRRQNVLYMGANAGADNYGGIGNAFYYDYHKYVANQGLTAGTPFPADKTLDKTKSEGSNDYVLRLGANVNGEKTVQIGDGIKDTSDFSHARNEVTINGTKYGHAFGFSFYKAPTVDKVAFYLPTNSDIVSIDIYGAVRTKDGDKTLYGKVAPDKAETEKEAPKFLLGKVAVPAAESGSKYIFVSTDLEAYRVEYIYFALNFKDGTSGHYKFYEIELYGIYDEAMNGIDIGAADFSALKAQYTDYRARVKDDYTEASWAKLVEALKTTDPVNKNALSTSEKIAAATETLKAAIAQLELKPVDKTKLKEAITAAKAKTNDGYTPKTWEALQNAITAAEALDASTEKLQQSAIDTATKALNDAVAGLRTRGDTTKLKAALDKAKELDEDYFQGSAVAWNMFMAAVKQGESLLTDENADQETIDKVTDDITYRQGNLLLTPGMSWPPEEEPAEEESNTDTQSETAPPAEEDGGCGGCGSSAAISAVALVSIIGTAVVIKKKED